MITPPDPQEVDTSAAAAINRLGRGILIAVLLLAAVQVLAIGPQDAVRRVSDGIRSIVSI